ncbi:hypothetical protein CLS_06080 [[Clostridium] cf. saccharolyticum K10]|nr:hypothetical protein CLS_06080 [[Clostridium] cf. saccharolyticum K10]
MSNFAGEFWPKAGCLRGRIDKNR